jgi:hypothetical protein
MIWAHYFYNKVSAQPELILRPWIALIQHKEQIRLTKGSGSYLNAQWRKEHITASGLDEGVERKEE